MARNRKKRTWKRRYQGYRQPKIDTSKKLWSFAFFLAVPTAFVVALLLASTLYTSISVMYLSRDRWVVFLVGFIATSTLFASSSLTTLRTWIHEMKHALVILFTGNKLTEFKVAGEVGHVSYLMYADRLRFAPFIALAPYFFPAFSGAALLACLILEFRYPELVTVSLGAALGTDIVTAYRELGPHQSDIQRIFGGRLLAYGFIFLVNAVWTLLCLLWVQAGARGFALAAYELVEWGNGLFM